MSPISVDRRPARSNTAPDNTAPDNTAPDCPLTTAEPTPPSGEGVVVVSVISAPHAFNEDDLFVDLRTIFGHQLFLKCEGFNFAGSIKLKAATEMVEAAERDGH